MEGLRKKGIFSPALTVGLSPEHVNALNLVEVDFYRCADVQAAWCGYKGHLFKPEAVEKEQWRKTKERLLAKLLSEIGKVLSYKIDAMDIYEKVMHQEVGRIETSANLKR